MAREQANVRLSIWTDPDFRALSVEAQHLYLLILTSPSLSYAGVADWRPKRIAALASGWVAGAVETAAAELQASRFLIVDEATDEVLVRSFLRHDGLMAREFMATAAAKAYEGVASARIRGVIVHELLRLRRDEPSLFGWSSKRLLAVLQDPSVDPSEMDPSEAPAMPFDKASDEPLPLPIGEASGEEPPTTTTTTSTSSTSTNYGGSAAAFERFWAEYPRKVKKADARKAWPKACKHLAPDLLAKEAIRWADLWRKAGTSEQYVPHPTTWLNGQRWNDDPPPPRAVAAGGHQTFRNPADQSAYDQPLG
ncbi:hypothetical protein ABZU76_02930 [Amycolatopsis sp. NPDC005232]|uniref:hypothetical protein n=1 Tax=Amycolatopsis sp. NPDC005232 TaxID=3157027 RepID=UPI0033A6738A